MGVNTPTDLDQGNRLSVLWGECAVDGLQDQLIIRQERKMGVDVYLKIPLVIILHGV